MLVPNCRTDELEHDEPHEMTWDELAARWPQRALEIDRETLSNSDADNIVYYAEQWEEGKTAAGNVSPDATDYSTADESTWFPAIPIWRSWAIFRLARFSTGKSA